MYSSKSKYYVDAVKVGLNSKIYNGTSIDKLNLKNHIHGLIMKVNKQKILRDLDGFQEVI